MNKIIKLVNTVATWAYRITLLLIVIVAVCIAVAFFGGYCEELEELTGSWEG